MMNEQVYENMKKYAAMLAGDGYVECGYIAVKADDGLYITAPDADFKDLAEDKITFVTDKSVEEFEGNFRAAAVLLICALKTKTDDGAAAIVDSKSILEFSARKMTLPPILEDSAQINGVSVRATKQNTAAEVVGAISGARNACFLPDAGAVVTGRTLAEVYTCTLVLDKACNGYLLAEKKGGAQHLNAFEAWLEHMVYKLKYSKKNQSSQKAAEEGKEVDTAEKPSAIDTDELRAVAQEIKDAGIKLLEENLVQGTWGNIAVRLNDKEMMATPLRHAQARADGDRRHGEHGMARLQQAHQRKGRPRRHSQDAPRKQSHRAHPSLLRLHPRRDEEASRSARRVS